MADRDHEQRRHGEPSGYRGQGGGHYGEGYAEGYGRSLRQGEPTYDPDDVAEGARRSKWREDQRYEDTGWTAGRSFSGDRDHERGPEDRYGEGRRDWTRFERDRGGSGGYGQYGAGGFARGGYGQSGYGGDYGQRQHGQTTYGGEGRGRSGAQDRDFEPDYLDWRNERLAGYDRDYEQWRADQTRRHDDEYRTWRGERRGAFHRTFEDWRRTRDLDRRTDELRTDDKVQEITEGQSSFRTRFPDDDDRGDGRMHERSASDDLAAGRNPALERQAEGRGDREFPPIPRRGDDDDRAREAYRGSGDGVERSGENPALGRIAEGEDGGLLSSLKRRDDESDEDFDRRLEAARTSQAASASDDSAGDPGISANPTLDKLTGGRKDRT